MVRGKSDVLYLKPGQYAVAGPGRRLRTLLGSCVSITLWHPQLRIGAMSHFLLATRQRPADGKPDARYGDEAMTLMLADLAALGVAPRECQGKIFGGSDMFPKQPKRELQVGARNGEQARALLRAAGIAQVSENLFGVGHREILFDTDSGNVWSRQVHPDELGQDAVLKLAGRDGFSLRGFLDGADLA